MAKMFRALVKSNSIEEFTIKGVSNKTITFVDLDGGEKSSMKMTLMQGWFHNKEEAKEFLTEKLEHRIKMHELAIKIAKVSLEKIKEY